VVFGCVSVLLQLHGALMAAGLGVFAALLGVRCGGVSAVMVAAGRRGRVCAPPCGLLGLDCGAM
jgi:hypothetical protein